MKNVLIICTQHDSTAYDGRYYIVRDGPIVCWWVGGDRCVFWLGCLVRRSGRMTNLCYLQKSLIYIFVFDIVRKGMVDVIGTLNVQIIFEKMV